jgi:hypothetical protein
MSAYIDFAPVAPHDAYPIYVAAGPIYSPNDGRELSWYVRHTLRRIEINPRADRDAAIAFAVRRARESYPVSAHGD